MPEDSPDPQQLEIEAAHRAAKRERLERINSAFRVWSEAVIAQPLRAEIEAGAKSSGQPLQNFVSEIIEGFAASRRMFGR